MFKFTKDTLAFFKSLPVYDMARIKAQWEYVAHPDSWVCVGAFQVGQEFVCVMAREDHDESGFLVDGYHIFQTGMDMSISLFHNWKLWFAARLPSPRHSIVFGKGACVTVQKSPSGVFYATLHTFTYSKSFRIPLHTSQDAENFATDLLDSLPVLAFWKETGV